MSKNHLSLTFVGLTIASALSTFSACNRFSECEKTGTCESTGGSSTGGQGTGSSSTGGGNLGGGGSSSTGGTGTGGTADPCDSCTGETPFCNSAKECVECLKNTDCTATTASSCHSDNSCAGCEDDVDCNHLSSTKVCNVGESTCVECLSSDDCAGNPCNPVTHECSAFGTDRLPCQSCDTDENCETLDHLCVPMKFDGADRPGGYCLKKTPSCTKPFSSLLTGRTSLSGVTGSSYCGINEALATCEAVAALLDDVTCSSGNDSECPESGVCKDIGGTLSNRCTYKCSGVSDCKESGAGSTCGPSPNDFCGYVP